MNINSLFPIILILLTFEVESKIYFENTADKTKLALSHGENLVISWTQKIEESYSHSRLLIRKHNGTALIAIFNDSVFEKYDNIYINNIVKLGKNQIIVKANRLELNDAFVSIEEVFNRSKNTCEYIVYNHIPIIITSFPEIKCYKQTILLKNYMSIECQVVSRPKSTVNVAFEIAHNGYSVNEDVSTDKDGSIIAKVNITFLLRVNLLNTRVYIHAKVGKQSELANFTISPHVPPFGVTLFFDEDESPVQFYSTHKLNRDKITIHCSSQNGVRNTIYKIITPTKETINSQLIILDQFVPVKHVGTWKCYATNEYGTTESQHIEINYSKEPPRMPLIFVNDVQHPSNTFSIDNLTKINVECRIYGNNYPSIKYNLQRINNGADSNITTSSDGKFQLNYDNRYHENIFTCRATNAYGQSAPAVFYLHKKENLKTFSLNNPVDINNSYAILMCILVTLLFITILLIFLKMKNTSTRKFFMRFIHNKMCFPIFKKFKIYENSERNNILLEYDLIDSEDKMDSHSEQ